MELFGTDGIRGQANTYPMTPEVAVRAGRAAVIFIREQHGVDCPKIVIGRDTRISGMMLEAAVMAGICSMGGEAVSAGVMPTPGVAYLARTRGADAGIVISASHNPFEDNGIKFFKSTGYKLSDTEEADLESLVLDDHLAQQAEAIKEIGQFKPMPGAARQYTEFLEGVIDLPDGLKGMRLAVDCSNGATAELAPGLFRKMGAETIPLAYLPDGVNINADCGSQHPQKLAETVLNNNLQAGLAFDGDGDRLIAVDEKGTILTGDQIVGICAKYLNNNDRLKNNTVVTTVMSNIGLGLALDHEGIRHVKSDVGDRYVMEEMLKTGAVLGGEDSGHIIFLDHHTTGDGMLAALKLLEVMISTGKPLSELAKIMTVFPQELKNVPVASKPDLAAQPEIQKIIKSVESDLNGKGRVLVRYSGTQPMCRVMVEAPTGSDAKLYVDRIAVIIGQQLG